MKAIALLVFLFSLTPTMVSAQAYKCRTASGKVLISDDPCRDGATAENYIATERGGSVTNSIVRPSAPIKREESGMGAGKNYPSQAIPASPEETQGYTGYSYGTPHGTIHSKTPLEISGSSYKGRTQNITIDGVTWQPKRR
jgi:Domain of unknown function (DUF4124)